MTEHADVDLQEEALNLIEVCPVEKIPQDTAVGALIDGHPVAVFKLGSTENTEFYVIDGVDPFTSVANLARGMVGTAEGAPFVAAPLYKQRFNLATGQCLDDDSVRLETWDVSVSSGKVAVRTKAVS